MNRDDVAGPGLLSCVLLCGSDIDLDRDAFADVLARRRADSVVDRGGDALMATRWHRW
ncbi:MAG: hypothetical protein U0Q22_18540 [Acidimicrobiales bacterium]